MSASTRAPEGVERRDEGFRVGPKGETHEV
jgi:hypothetical protein